MGGLSPDTASQTNNLLRLLVTHADNRTLSANDLDPPFTPGPGVVRQNCFLFASLFSSLLAAAGAVLAKQWLANYERTGQTGTAEEQGLRRTEKYIGAKTWKLHNVVDALPTLILVSLGLFFVAVADYVRTINREVAVVIIAFSSIGIFLYVLMLVSAALFTDCPYQTAPSLALKYLFFLLFGIVFWSLVAVSAFFFFVALASLIVTVTIYFLAVCTFLGPLVLIVSTVRVVIHIIRGGREEIRHMTPERRQSDNPGHIPTAQSDNPGHVPTIDRSPRAWGWVPLVSSILRSRERLHPLANRPVRGERKNSQHLYAESARSLLQISPRNEVILAVAHNIPAIQSFEAVQLLTRSSVFPVLLDRLHKLLLDFPHHPSNIDTGETLVIARAVNHILLAGPSNYTIDILRRLITFSVAQAPDVSTWLRSTELKLLWSFNIRLSAFSRLPTLQAGLWSEEKATVDAFRAIPFKELIHRGLASARIRPRSTAEGYLHQFILSESLLLPIEGQHLLLVQGSGFLDEDEVGGKAQRQLVSGSFGIIRALLADSSITSTHGFLALVAKALAIALRYWVLVGRNPNTSRVEVNGDASELKNRAKHAWLTRSG